MLRLIVIVLLVFVAGIAYSDNPSPSSGEKNQPVQKKSASREKPAAQDERGTEKVPLVIKGIPSENTPQQAAEDRKERDAKAAEDRWLTFYTGLQSLFTGLLIIVGGFQLVLFWYQLRYIRESLADTKKAADAAQKSADAADRSIKSSEDTAKKELRAYIYVDSYKDALIDVKVDDKESMEIHLLLKNAGKTPAFSLNHWINASVLQFPLRSELLNLEAPAQQSIYVPPNCEITLIAPIAHGWTTDLLDFCSRENESDPVRLYVWGEVHYTDAFNNPRFVKFRFMSRGPGGGASLDYSLEGNDAN